MKLFNKIIIFVLLISPFSFSYGVWVSVDAGTWNPGVLVHEKVNLIWQVSWVDSSCSLTYSWVRNWWTGSPITIYNPNTLNSAYFYGPNETVWGQNIIIDFVVTVSWCSDAWTYTDSVIYAVDPYFLNTVAGDDISLNELSTVNLSWTYYGATYSCSSPTYQWTQTGTNMSIDLFDESLATSRQFSFSAPSVGSSQNFQLEFTVDCWFTSKKDLLILTINDISSTWSSRVSQAANIADRIFSTVNLDNIKLVLQKNETIKLPALEYYWNDLWWDWLIKYEFQISADKNFSKYETYSSVFNRVYLIEDKTIKLNPIVYMRVRAIYNGKASGYSEVLKYIDIDRLLMSLIFKKWWESKILFDDALWKISKEFEDFNLKKKIETKSLKLIDLVK